MIERAAMAVSPWATDVTVAPDVLAELIQLPTLAPGDIRPMLCVHVDRSAASGTWYLGEPKADASA